MFTLGLVLAWNIASRATAGKSVKAFVPVLVAYWATFAVMLKVVF